MKVIPLKKRIKVYKRALEIIENEEDVYGVNRDYGLCILFRCIDLNLNHFLEEEPNGKSWNFHDTPKLYPEFSKYYDSGQKVKFRETFHNNRNLWRRVVLRLILEELKANEEY